MAGEDPGGNGERWKADPKLAAEEERRIEAEKEQQRNAEGRKKPGEPDGQNRYRTNLIPRRNATSPIRTAASMKSKRRLRPSL